MAEQEFPAGGYPAAGAWPGFPELAAPYQEDSSYSENNDGSYEAAGAAAATQSHFSSFSFECGLQSHGPPPPCAAYPQSHPACQSYPTGSHCPALQYSYPFTKYPPSGPGPGSGAPVATRPCGVCSD